MLDGLNKQQLEAVVNSFDSNCLVIAGAGAGKTRVLTTRIAYAIKELEVSDSSIMAITFTNKAAKEMLERINKTVDASNMWIGTYHYICIRILKMFGSEIGLDYFSILLPKESKKIAFTILNNMRVPATKQLVNNYLNKISDCKGELKTYQNVKKEVALGKLSKEKYDDEFLTFYEEFQNYNWNSHMLDFDDIILYTVTLIKKSRETREYIHNRFKYVFGDESQDSNTANMVLMMLISGGNNLFLVGKLVAHVKPH